MDFYKRIIKNRIERYATTQLQRLATDNFKPGAGLFNFRCHQNSVQKFKEGQAEKILFCLCVDLETRTPFLHFINQLESGYYQDNTLGYESATTEYYLIREILPEEIVNILQIFDRARTSIILAHSQQPARFFLLKDTDFI